jgi:hypothetical protein
MDRPIGERLRALAAAIPAMSATSFPERLDVPCILAYLVVIAAFLCHILATPGFSKGASAGSISGLFVEAAAM